MQMRNIDRESAQKIAATAAHFKQQLGGKVEDPKPELDDTSLRASNLLSIQGYRNKSSWILDHIRGTAFGPNGDLLLIPKSNPENLES